MITMRLVPLSERSHDLGRGDELFVRASQRGQELNDIIDLTCG